MNQRLGITSSLDNGPILVIDIGGTHVKFGCTVDGRPLDYRKRIPSTALNHGDAVATLAAMIEGVIDECALRPSAIVAAIPGYIDTDFDRVLTASNVAGFEGRRVASDLAAHVGCPVYLERDSILALMGEVHCGAARGCDHVMGVYFGTGVGGAFIDNGKPFRGAGWALELGLMPFMLEGRRIEGLRDDCLETYASGRALHVIAQRHHVPIEQVFDAARRHDDLQRELDRFVLYQAVAIGMGIAMMSPKTVVLGGGVLDMAGYPREALRSLVERHAPVSETRRALDLRWSEHGWAAVLHGAAAYASTADARSTDAGATDAHSTDARSAHARSS